MQILIIRHAESNFNTKNTKNLDSELTARGKRQATELSAFLKRKFDDISTWKGYVSPFLRTLQTAKIVWEHTDINFQVDWRLREYASVDSGYLWKTKLFIPARKESFPNFFKNVTEDGWKQSYEQEEKMLSRMINFLEFIKNQPDEKVVLISHGVPIYTMIYILKNTPMVPKWDRKILNTSVTWVKDNQLKYIARFVNSGDDPRYDRPRIPVI